METLDALQRKITTTETLLSVVKTMKALAAVNIRQYEKAVVSLQEYNRTIELGLQAVLRMSPHGGAPDRPALDGRVGAIVIGSDQGMCGVLNEQIVSYTLDALHALGIHRDSRAMIAIGLRVATRLEDAGELIEHVMPMPGAAETIAPLVQTLLVTIEEWRAQAGIERLFLFYNRFLSGAKYQPHTLLVLPLDMQRLRVLQKTAWPSRALPLFTMERERLFSRLIRQYLFVILARACAESLASENASRLLSMQNAERNIRERFEELQAQFHQQRQMEITGELLDIVAGFEALGGAQP